MQPRDAMPSHDESAAENDEQHKRNVEDDDGVGEDAEGHGGRYSNANSVTQGGGTRVCRVLLAILIAS
jgi:hypothetical protein